MRLSGDTRIGDGFFKTAEGVASRPPLILGRDRHGHQVEKTYSCELLPFPEKGSRVRAGAYLTRNPPGQSPQGRLPPNQPSGKFSPGHCANPSIGISMGGRSGRHGSWVCRVEGYRVQFPRKRCCLLHCNGALKMPIGDLCQKCAKLSRLRAREPDERKPPSISWAMSCHADRPLNYVGSP